MARIPAGIKVEKVCSKDVSRPLLTGPAVVEWQGGKALAATDSYKLVVFPLEDAEGLALGPLDLNAVKAAVKDGHEITSADGLTQVLDANGLPQVTARNIDGQYPKVESLVPDAFEGASVGFSARYLYELSQAMGSDTVRLDFIAVKGDDGEAIAGSVNALRPMRVTAFGKRANTQAVGLLMPIRLSDAGSTR